MSMVDEKESTTVAASIVSNCDSEGQSEAKEIALDQLVAERLDLKDNRLHRVQFKKWVAEKSDKKATPLEENVLTTVCSIPALSAIADHEAKEIALKAELANLELHQRRATLAVDENEEIDPGVDWSLHIVKGCDDGLFKVLLAKSEKTLEAEAYGRLFALTKALPDAEDCALEKMREGDFSTEFEEVFEALGGFEEFAGDLAELILESGDEARKLIRSVCTNKSTADRVAKDEDKPKPVLFLARLAMKELE